MGCWKSVWRGWRRCCKRKRVIKKKRKGEKNESIQYYFLSFVNFYFRAFVC